MRKTTLLFLVDRGNNKILLGMKKRGFGSGKWNGIGGKVQDGEGVEASVIREAREEIGVQISDAEMQRVAVLDFLWDEKPEWDQEVHVFFVEEWSGELVESEEMRPEWFGFEALPFQSMWVDDEHWLPRLIGGEKLRAKFTFDHTGDKILDMQVESRANLD